MAIFRFIDEIIGGSIQFLFSLAATLLMLLMHPITGPAKLYRRSTSIQIRQVSSLTYLAVSILSSLLLLSQFTPHAVVDLRSSTAKGGFASDSIALLQGLMTSPSDGILALLAGALLTTAILSALPRIAGWVRGLRRRRAERFIVEAEYVLGQAALALVGWEFLKTPAVDHPALKVVLTVAVVALYISSSLSVAALLTLSFWRSLWGSRVLRLASRSIRAIGRHGFAHTADYRRQLVRSAEGSRNLLSLYGGAAPVLLGAVILYFGIWISLTRGAELSEKIVSGNRLEQRRQLTFYPITCDLRAEEPTAHFVAFNASSQPAVKWLPNFLVLITDQTTREFEYLNWHAALPDGVRSDFLAAGASVDLIGRLDVPARLRQRLRTQEFGISCAVARKTSAVRTENDLDRARNEKERSDRRN